MCSTVPGMMEEKFYKPMEAYLTIVNNECVAMEEIDTKRSVEVTFKVLDELINKMKEANKMFSWMFNRLTHVGSYFDGLRVKEATEFDINVILKLPLVYEKMVVTRDPKFPGFVKVNVKNAKYSGEKLKLHEKETEEIFKWWATADGDLSHIKVLRWWESIFSKLKDLSTLTVDGRVFKITKFRKSGPAITAHISDDNYGIDVDLVPVIEFHETIKPPSPIRREPGPWYIVPKPVEGNEFVWRLSFPPQEKALMNGKNKLKMVNRFCKRLRDVFEWKLVSSYYIKTMFLWEASTQKDPTFFQKNFGYLLIYFFGKWIGYMEMKRLPFYWDEKMNLFEKINDITLANYACRLKRIKSQIERMLLEGNDSGNLNNHLKTLFYQTGDGVKLESLPINRDDISCSSFSLIDLDGSEDDTSNTVPVDDLFPAHQSTDIRADLTHVVLDVIKPPDDFVTSSVHSCSSFANLTAPTDSGCSSSSSATPPDTTSLHSWAPPRGDMEAANQKNMLEIEECKVRLRIAQLDLETAKYNLKTALKRYEMINSQFNSLEKSNI